MSPPAPPVAAGEVAGARWVDRVSPVWLVLGGIASVQLGAAIAKDLFGAVSPTAMVWLRLITSTVILLVVARPRVRGRQRADWSVVLGFGAVLAAMNWSFYQAMARIPLGVAVTIEFLGPLLVAVVGSRRPRDGIWVLLAGGGVALLGFSPARLDPVGVALALVAGGCWALYILLSASTGRRWPGLSGLGLASAVGAVSLAAPAVWSAGPALLRPEVLLIGVAVGVLSSAVPYSLELLALRRMPPALFGILLSLEPAAAAAVAMLVLGEFLTLGQWLAVGCVVAASVGATRSSPRPPTEAVNG